MIFTCEQADAAYAIGTQRYDHHARLGTKQRWNKERSEDDRHDDGMAAVAEATVAAFLGIEWGGQSMRPDDGTDVAGCIGVRWTPRARGGLIVHPTDRSNVPQVLVIGERYPLRCAGWKWPREALVPKYWRDDIRSPAHIVPQRDLEPMRTLIRWLQERNGK